MANRQGKPNPASAPPFPFIPLTLVTGRTVYVHRDHIQSFEEAISPEWNDEAPSLVTAFSGRYVVRETVYQIIGLISEGTNDA
jgi:hypothetical protein